MTRNESLQVLYRLLKTQYLENPDIYISHPPYITGQSGYMVLSNLLEADPYYQKLLYIGKPCFLMVFLQYLEISDVNQMRNPFLTTLLLTLITKSHAGQKVSLALIRWFRMQGWDFPFLKIEMYNLQEDYPVDYTNYDTPPAESIRYRDLPPKPEVIEQPKHIRWYSLEEIEYWRKKIDQFRYGNNYVW